jgi:hypothetical protein
MQVVYHELLCKLHICKPIWCQSVAVTRILAHSDATAFEFQPILRVYE